MLNFPITQGLSAGLEVHTQPFTLKFYSFLILSVITPQKGFLLSLLTLKSCEWFQGLTYDNHREKMIFSLNVIGKGLTASF